MAAETKIRATASLAVSCGLLENEKKIRLAFPVASPLYVTRDKDGSMRGISIELGRELAARVGVVFEPVPFPTVRDLLASVGSGAWDLATLIVEAERTHLVQFSRPYMEADSTYLVKADSGITNCAAADTPGILIGVADGSSFEIFLRQHLSKAKLICFPGIMAAFAGFQAQQIHAVAGPRPLLALRSPNLVNSRVLPDAFDIARVAIALPKTAKPEALNFINMLVTEMVSTAAISNWIANSGVVGVRPLPSE